MWSIHRCPKKEQRQEAPGSENGWWRGIGHWLVHPLCPRNQFILCPCPAPALNEGEPKTGSAQKHPPWPRAQFPLYFSSEWFIQIAMSTEKNEWPGRLYVWVSLLIRLLQGGKWEGRLGGMLLLSIQWGENWSMQVSDVGFNVCKERSICIVAAQMVCADRMFWVPLLASLSDPASACVPVQLAPTTVAWHSLTWNYCVWEPQTISHTLHWSVVVFVLSANQSLSWILCLDFYSVHSRLLLYSCW